ncbi:hypothetical protein K492DRAFT_174263 [Lichtheimia hyalospora FSU 10163]|nr:hypothetical protein K492DRAFT_174263 [Lichtheimia hyalospora FSU 10163]
MTNFGPLDFSTTRNRFGDIKIPDHLMAVNARCHFNALGSSYQQKVISIFKYYMVALDAFSSSQNLRVYSLVKTWIICAYAICDA